jgi:hypothetical protein
MASARPHRPARTPPAPQQDEPPPGKRYCAIVFVFSTGWGKSGFCSSIIPHFVISGVLKHYSTLPYCHKSSGTSSGHIVPRTNVDEPDMSRSLCSIVPSSISSLEMGRASLTPRRHKSNPSINPWTTKAEHLLLPKDTSIFESTV